MARKTYTTLQRRWAIDQVRNGATRRAVAAALGAEEGIVQYWCKKAGLPKKATRWGRGADVKTASIPPEPEDDTPKSRRIYLARLMRAAIPDAIEHAKREFRRKLEDP